MSSNATGVPFRGDAMRILPSSMLGVVLVATATAASLFSAHSQRASITAVAAGAICAALMIVPRFWLAAALVLMIPFHQLISALLAGQSANAGKIGAPWELLILIGIFRVVNNPDRDRIVAGNRWVLFWSGFLLLAYSVAFLRSPGIPALYGLNLGIRLLGVLVFFMFLRLDREHIATLLRLMVWGVGMLAAYGVIQYFWDYDRLLPFLYSNAKYGLYSEGDRRLYSYSFNAFEPAYTAVIAILILLSRSLRCSLPKVLCWVALFLACLTLTYTRSGYVALLAGIASLCMMDRTQLRRAAALAIPALCLGTGFLLFSSQSAEGSSFGRRLQSIISQSDPSSVAHKDSLAKAVRDISLNPSGVGFNTSGIIVARFVGADAAEYTENWVLQAGVQAGVLAVFAYVGLTLTILWSLFHVQCRDAHDAALMMAAASIFVAMSIASLLIQVWDCETTCVYTWAIVGMALASSTSADDDKSRDANRTQTLHAPRFLNTRMQPQL
jgi:hypothetical protein